MAGAPHKQGLDFFSFDVHTFKDNKIQELLEVHKDRGFVFYMQIRCAILSKSNYLEWNKFEIRDFRKSNEYEPSEINIYLNYLLDNGLLNRRLFERYNILTSEEIQGRYMLATQERSKVIFVQEYLLINFDDFRFIKQVIHLRNIEGELLERFSKKGGIKVNPETKLPIKSPKNKGILSSPSEPAPPPPAAAAVPDKPLNFTPYTSKDVNAFIRITYDDRDEIFKDSYSKKEYDEYVLLNKKINSKYEAIRKSIRQLTFPEYVEFMEESTPTPTQKELEAAFKKMASMRIDKHHDIYRNLAQCLETKTAPAAADPKDLPENKPADNIVDRELELSILKFWGLKEVMNHKQEAFIRAFIKVINDRGELDEFRQRFRFYMPLTEIRGLTFRHKLVTFLGTQEKTFSDGKWDTENWEQLLEAENIKQISLTHGKSKRTAAIPEQGYGKV